MRKLRDGRSGHRGVVWSVYHLKVHPSSHPKKLRLSVRSTAVYFLRGDSCWAFHEVWRPLVLFLLPPLVALLDGYPSACTILRYDDYDKGDTYPFLGMCLMMASLALELCQIFQQLLVSLPFLNMEHYKISSFFGEGALPAYILFKGW